MSISLREFLIRSIKEMSRQASSLIPTYWPLEPSWLGPGLIPVKLTTSLLLSLTSRHGKPSLYGEQCLRNTGRVTSKSLWKALLGFLWFSGRPRQPTFPSTGQIVLTIW